MYISWFPHSCYMSPMLYLICFLIIIISGSTALCGPWPPLVWFHNQFLQHTVGLPGWAISSSQGLYLHRTTQHKKTKDKHPCQFLIVLICPPEPSGSEAGESWVRNRAGKFCWQSISVMLCRVLLHAIDLWHGTNGSTSPQKEVHAMDFYHQVWTCNLGSHGRPANH
jgi:hypothetical protein